MGLPGENVHPGAPLCNTESRDGNSRRLATASSAEGA